MDAHNGAVIIPEWFLCFLSAALMLIVPWCIWVTRSLIRIMERTAKHQMIAKFVLDVRRELREHMMDHRVHVAAKSGDSKSDAPDAPDDPSPHSSESEG